MMNRSRHLVSANPQRVLLRAFLIGALSTVGVLFSLVPNFHPLTGLSAGGVAHAQSVTDAEVENYARSVLAIERLRQEAFSQMRNVLGNREVPSIVCSQPNSLDNQRREIREIAVSYCTDSAQVVQQNSLSISRFNAITNAQQNDPQLAERIRQVLIRLQRNR